ncbi:MAG: NAD(P)H-binding protein [Gemmatimonadota bacterium]
MKIAITGANSSVGLSFLGNLIARGDADVVACVRSERAAAKLPRSPRVAARVVAYDNHDALAAALEGIECLVHLAGILIEWPGTTYEAANVATAEAAARAAASAGVRHLVQVSVVGASAPSDNRYFRTKAQAEDAFVRSQIPATILRTPILLGPGTAGAGALTRVVRSGRARLLGGGRYTMRPLDVDDLCAALSVICRARPDGAVVHELVGPEPIEYRALVKRAARHAGVTVSVASLPIGVAKAGAWVRSRLERGGVTPTVIDVITMDEHVKQNADAALGLTLTPLDETLNKLFPSAGAR